MQHKLARANLQAQIAPVNAHANILAQSTHCPQLQAARLTHAMSLSRLTHMQNIKATTHEFVITNAYDYMPIRRLCQLLLRNITQAAAGMAHIKRARQKPLQYIDKTTLLISTEKLRNLCNANWHTNTNQARCRRNLQAQLTCRIFHISRVGYRDFRCRRVP